MTSEAEAAVPFQRKTDGASRLFISRIFTRLCRHGAEFRVRNPQNERQVDPVETEPRKKTVFRADAIFR